MSGSLLLSIWWLYAARTLNVGLSCGRYIKIQAMRAMPEMMP